MIEWGIPEKMLGLVGGGSSSKGSRHIWEKMHFLSFLAPGLIINRAQNEFPKKVFLRSILMVMNADKFNFK